MEYGWSGETEWISRLDTDPLQLSQDQVISVVIPNIETKKEKKKGRKDKEKKEKKKKGILSIYLLYIHSHPLGPPHVPFTIELKYTHGKKSFFR